MYISITKSSSTSYISNLYHYSNTQLKQSYKPYYSLFNIHLPHILIQITNSPYIFNIDPDLDEAIKYNTTITNIIYTNFKKSFHLITTPSNFNYILM